MSIYAITPTGCRPEGLALLGEYLNAQTYDGPLTWVVVDDCDPPTRIPRVRSGIEVLPVRPGWRWEPGQNTQAACMRAGLEWVPDDGIVFVLEDDDVYLPSYIERMLSLMPLNELAGEIEARYYNVQTGRCRTLRGKYHAALASTVCRGGGLMALRNLVSGALKKMIDVTLWREFKGRKTLTEDHNVVGIKGLPGRPGVGVGHRRNFGLPDNGDTLRAWAGEYAGNYEMFRVGM